MHLVNYCCPVKTKIGMCPQISANLSNVKYHETPCICPRVDKYMQTDGGVDGRIISTFRCECSMKMSLRSIFLNRITS